MTSVDFAAPSNGPESRPGASAGNLSTYENIGLLVRIVLTACTVGAAACLELKTGGHLRSAMAFAYFSLVPGVAVVRWLRPLKPVAAYALALPISLAINCAVATAAVWTHTFHAFVLLFVTATVSLYGFWRPKFGDAATTRNWTALRIRIAQLANVEVWVPLATLATSFALWHHAIASINAANLGDYGLLPRFGISFYVALGLLICSFIFSLTRKTQRAWLLGAHLTLLIWILHGTAPSIFSAPRYPWVYKHFGVVEYISAHGTVDGNIDIYNNWPGFFAGAAWLSQLMGLHVVQYAGWSQVFFNLTYFLELSFIYQVLNVNYRVRWLALLIFLSTNWVGQDYFSPQAFSLTLALAIFGTTLGWLRTEFRGPVAWIVRKAVPARKNEGARTPDGTARPSGWRNIVPLPGKDESESRTAPLLMVLGLFSVIVVSHQLSPYMVVLGILGMTLLRGVRPLWLLVALGAIAVGYLAIHYGYITKHFGPLFGNSDPLKNAKSNGQGTHPSSGVAWVANATRALTAIVWLLGLAGFIRRLRNGQRELTVGALAVAPFVVLGAQNYGGEAIFRVYLFSLPWFSLLAAYAILPRVIKLTKVFVLLRVCGLFVGAVLFLSSYFGLEQIYNVEPQEVNAADHFYDQAPTGSVLFSGDQGFPIRNNGRYYLFSAPGGGDVVPNLATFPEFAGHILGPADMSHIDDYVDGWGAPYSFFAFTQSAVTYAHSYGQMPDGSLENLQNTFATDPGWREWYRDGDVVIYERVKVAS